MARSGLRGWGYVQAAFAVVFVVASFVVAVGPGRSPVWAALAVIAVAVGVQFLVFRFLAGWPQLVLGFAAFLGGLSATLNLTERLGATTLAWLLCSVVGYGLGVEARRAREGRLSRQGANPSSRGR